MNIANSSIQFSSNQPEISYIDKIEKDQEIVKNRL